MTNEQSTNIDISCLREDPEEIQVENRSNVSRQNPRLVYTNPDRFFGQDFYMDLLLEQMETM